MSMRALLVGYALILALFIVGCFAVHRGVPGLRGIRTIRLAFSMAFAGVILLAGRALIPSFLSITVANLAIFSTYVLFHQAINDILELNKRYVRLSLTLGLAMLVTFPYYTSIHPDITARVYIVSAITAIQTAVTTFLLFRYAPEELRRPVRAAGWVIASTTALYLVRIAFTGVWSFQPDILHPSSFQAFFTFANCILGIGAGLSLLWLSLCENRDKLQTLALTDTLTGLLNRRALEDALQSELIYAARHGRTTGLLLIDLDFFKNINDTYGHPIGDEVIRRLGQTLQSVARGSDALARFGGEEFILMLRDTDLLQASLIAERIRLRIAALGDLPVSLRITASIGVAVSESADTVESLLKNADVALYRSKSSGRNTVTCHRDRGQDAGDAAHIQSELIRFGQ
jgi:diguanylate cyclase (GGDEF)-like protein